MTYKFKALLPKDYCLIPGKGAIKLCWILTKLYVNQFLKLSPKNYELIPGKHSDNWLTLYSKTKLLSELINSNNWFWSDFSASAQVDK